MRQIVRVLPEGTVLLILILLAGFLRFYDYASFSFSNDELSAIVRADQPGFWEMIRNGVVPDGHPAGVETLMYFWIKWFGNSEASVRLPFILMGSLSIIPAYFIGKRWFGRVSGLYFAAFLAFLQFPLLFSQIARPYSAGLFVSLSMVLFWTRLIFPLNNDKSFLNYNIAGYAISTAACAYTHYFCGLMAIIVAISGFILIKRDRFFPYLISLIISTILFLPHITITIQQLSYGGIGEWLSKPGSDWVPQHLFYLFNQSWILVIAVITMLILSVILNRNNLSFNIFHIITLSWVLIPMLIGLTYSLLVNPVIQNSVLLFSSPFLYLFVSSWWNDKWTNKNALIFGLFSLFLLTDTVAVQRYYQQQHFGEFKDIAVTVDEWNVKYGSDQITQVISVNNPYYINLYFNKLKKSYTFAQYDNRGGGDLKALKRIVNRSTTPYFISAWTKPVPDEIDKIIREEYPCVIEKIDYQGLSAITLYSAKPVAGQRCLTDTADLLVTNNFEEGNLWGLDSKFLTSAFSSSGQQGVLLDHSAEFGPTYQSVLQDITAWPFKCVRISIEARMLEEGCNAQIVADVFTPQGKSYAWASANFNNYLNINERGKVYFSYFIPTNAESKDVLKVYVWNHGQKKVALDDFTLEFYK
ncbi:MAG: glycosyltransferase family 39 protein [Bacteroidales bacterium]